jgi:broad specificity phosphatase PhoE
LVAFGALVIPEPSGHTERRKVEPVKVDGIKELPVHITEDITRDAEALARGLDMNFDHISGQLRALQRTAQHLADELSRRPIDEEVDDIASESP